MQVTPDTSWILTVLVSVLSSSVVSGLIVLAVQTWVSTRVQERIHHEYAVKLEQLRADAARDHGIALERFRTECQIGLQERVLRFSRLQEKQAEAIAEMYGRLWAYLRALQSYVSVFQGPEMVERQQDNAEEVVRAKASLMEFYDPHRIYLTEALASSIDTFVSTLFSQAWSFRFGVVRTPDEDKQGDLWERIATFMEKNAPALFRDLENEFRRTLGHEEREAGG